MSKTKKSSDSPDLSNAKAAVKLLTGDKKLPEGAELAAGLSLHTTINRLDVEEMGKFLDHLGSKSK